MYFKPRPTSIFYKFQNPLKKTLADNLFVASPSSRATVKLIKYHYNGSGFPRQEQFPRKVRFAPKAPPRRDQKPILPKVEKVEDADDAAKAQELMQRFNEASMKTRPKLEKKPTQTRVTFGYGGGSSLKSYGAPKGGIGIKRVKVHLLKASGGAHAPGREIKEYKEPWDYYTYYPVTLPLRRPYSGNPEFLDEEEFGGTSETITSNESSTGPAVELDLMNVSGGEFGSKYDLPSVTRKFTREKQSVKEGHEVGSTSKSLKSSGPSGKACGLDELPAGFMGKMLVYKSGAVKLKLGDILYDVSAGLNCDFSQDVVAINTEEKHCCIVGELNKRAILIPDVDSILENISDL